MRPFSLSGPRGRRLLSLGTAAVPTLLFFACGSRTSLPAPEAIEHAPDGAVVDARARETGRDALVDTAIPGIDAQVRDARRDDCPDGDATLVYVVTEENELLSFNPPAGTFRRIGTLACPTKTPGSTPFSMAVDRTGVAYVLFNDGNLFRVSTKTAACIATSFVPGQQGFETFGMGFSSDLGGPAETLFIASDSSSTAVGLASIDVNDFTVTPIGPFDPSITRAELTGTGDGRLFAFYAGGQATSSFIGEIDKSNAAVIAEDELAGVNQGQGWAFAYWGGDFYTFTSPQGGSSRVTRFRPLTKQTSLIANYPSVIVGAGVSTCAPQQ
jgi:hypothetical protein